MNPWWWLLLLTACVKLVPVRASSAQHVTREEATVELGVPLTITESRLKSAAAGEGLRLTQKLPAGDSTLFIFKSGGDAGLGTWLAAHVAPTGSSTVVRLLAKPTLDGIELCSDADATLTGIDYWCKDTALAPGDPRRAQLTGAREAELIRHLSASLRGRE
jgi:hypothetical protein